MNGLDKAAKIHTESAFPFPTMAHKSPFINNRSAFLNSITDDSESPARAKEDPGKTATIEVHDQAVNVNGQIPLNNPKIHEKILGVSQTPHPPKKHLSTNKIQ